MKALNKLVGGASGDVGLLLQAVAVVVPLYLLASGLFLGAASARLTGAAGEIPASLTAQVGLPAPPRGVAWVGEVVAPTVDDRMRQFAYRLKQAAEDVALPGSGKAGAGVDEADRAKVEQLIGGLNSVWLFIGGKLFGWEQLFCYVLTVWAGLMILERQRDLVRREKELGDNPIGLSEGRMVTPADCSRLQAAMLARPSRQPRGDVDGVILKALKRFETAHEVAAAETVVQNEAMFTAARFDTELSMARYAAWAVPSIGFIGTVRGIGSALAVADSPSNLPQIVGFLAVAFDTTLIALFLSILAMFGIHRVQQQLETYAQNLARRCDELLVMHLYVPRH